MEGDPDVREPGDVHLLKVALEEGRRRLYFEKECLEDVAIYRRVDAGDWRVLATHARAPIVDDESFDNPVRLGYKATFGDNNESQAVEVTLP